MTLQKFPRADTLTGRALALMLQGQKITHRDFQNHSASYRLSSPIEVLRNRQGWRVVDEWLNSPTNDATGRRARFKRYWLEPETIRAAGKRGRRFVEAVKDYESRAAATAQARKAQHE